MDGQFAISFRAKRRGGKTRSRARAFSKEMGVGGKNPAKGTNVSSGTAISGKNKVAGDEVINPGRIENCRMF